MATFAPGLIHFRNESVVTEQGIDDRFIGTLVSIDFQKDIEFADNITTKFRVISRELENGTKVTCQTLYIEEMFCSSTTLSFAGIVPMSDICSVIHHVLFRYTILENCFNHISRR